MSVKRKAVNIPALIDGYKVIVSDKEKAEVLGKTFMSVYRGDPLTDIHKQLIDIALRENKDVMQKRKDDISTLDVDITMSELNSSAKHYTSTIQIQVKINYVMVFLKGAYSARYYSTLR